MKTFLTASMISRVTALCGLLTLGCIGDTAAATSDAEPLSQEQIRTLFTQGHEHFRRGLEQHAKRPEAAKASFSEAAAAWRSIVIDGDVHNAHLETNLANASLLAGETPRAIAAFRRAQELEPRNPTILRGLAAARRAAGTENLAPGAAPTPAKVGADGGIGDTLRRIGGFLDWAAERTFERLPPRLLLTAAAIGYIGAFGTLAARLLGSKRVGSTWPWAMGVLSLLAAGPLISHELASRAAPGAVLVQPGVRGRNGPAEMYDESFREPLAPGLEVTMIERRGEWSQIRLADGRSCWVPFSSLEGL